MNDTFLEENMSPFHSLTFYQELFGGVLDYLDIFDLFRAERCSKRLRFIITIHLVNLDRISFKTGGNSLAFSVKERLYRYTVADRKICRYLISSQNSAVTNTATDAGNHYKCNGCCEYSHYDSNNLQSMEYFVWIGGEPSSAGNKKGIMESNTHSSSSFPSSERVEERKGGSSNSIIKSCHWKGFVRNTYSSLLPSDHTQLALTEQNFHFACLLQLLTETSNRGEILEKTKTKDLADIVRKITATTSIYIVALSYFGVCNKIPPTPLMIIAATPESKHLHFHWDDSSYNPTYRKHDWLITTMKAIGSNDNSEGDNNDNNGRSDVAGLHLWFQVSRNKPASFHLIKADECLS